MPVPGSGELRLRADINQEVNGNDTDTNVSLGTLSDDAGFDTPPDAMSEFYGYSACTAPSVTTSANSSVSFTSMTGNGNVTNDNGCTITERGFYFGTSSSYASNTKYTVSGTTGSFSRSFTSLSSTTTYYCTAYAINSAGTTVGSTVSSQTLTPATYTALNTFTRNWEGPDRLSWAHCNSGNTSSTVASAAFYYRYNHASYGWTNYSSASRSLNGTLCGGSDPGTVTINGAAMKNNDGSTNTSHQIYNNQSINSYWTGYYATCSIAGDFAHPSTSGCNSGASSTYSKSYSSCSWRQRLGGCCHYTSCWGGTSSFYGNAFIEFTDTIGNPGQSSNWSITMTDMC